MAAYADSSIASSRWLHRDSPEAVELVVIKGEAKRSGRFASSESNHNRSIDSGC